MSRPVWITPAGNLGTIPELQFYELALQVSEPTGSPVTFKFLSGELPPGIQVVAGGILQGVPVVLDPITVDESRTYKFTVRATSRRPEGNVVVDRSFSLTITNVYPPVITPSTSNLGTVFDGTGYELQLRAIEENPTANLEWTLLSGQLPPGLSLSSSGLLSGYIGLQPASYDTGIKGYDAQSNVDSSIRQAYDKFPYDYAGRARSKIYTFTVQVSDGANFDTVTYDLRVVAKGLLTADQAPIVNATQLQKEEISLTIDNGDLTVDADNRYVPIITTPSQALPTVRQDSNFAFKFEGIDFEGDAIAWTLKLADGSGFDQDGDNETHLVGVGFDSTLFDQSASKLPPNLTMDNDTGWMYGVVIPQTVTTKTYNFIITASKRNYPTFISDPVVYQLTVLGSIVDQVTWDTDYNLGSLVNGAVSELSVKATSALGKGITYRLITTEGKTRLPQGLTLLDNGNISGRASFRFFTLDGQTTGFDNNKTTFDNGYEFTVEAKVVVPTFTNTYPANPYDGDYAINTNDAPFGLHRYSNGAWSQMSRVTVANNFPQSPEEEDYFIQLTNGNTLNLFQYIDSAWIAITTSSTKTFKITVDNTYSIPYENLYLKALPDLAQRKVFEDIIADETIFPSELIYRPTDPWFGKAKDIRFLELAGVHPSLVSEYMTAMSKNHYRKRINFGNIKTAIATDQYYNTKYEVVYVEVVDQDNPLNQDVKQFVDLSSTINPYISNGVNYTMLYPNSLENMDARVVSDLGYSARGVYPDWMLSVQPNRTVLGFSRAIVLAYTVPGASKLIAYRLRDKNKLDSINQVDFTVDRYNLDSTLSAHFNPVTDKFLSGNETTFDFLRLAGIPLDGGTVNYATRQAFSSINERTVEYILQRGGIDNVKNFKDGDTLIFAQQEGFNTTDPNDGWIKYNDLYFGNATTDDVVDSFFDVSAYDGYTTIPGFKEQQLSNISTQIVSATTAGASEIYVPYVVGTSYLNNSVESDGTSIPTNTYVAAQSVITMTINSTNQLVTVLTLNQAVSANIVAGTTVTLSPSLRTNVISSGYTLTVNSVPDNLLVGNKLLGVGIPDGTAVTEINGNVITVNNQLGSTIPANTLIKYSVINQRAGIWKIVIGEDNIVRLDFIKEITIGQTVKVLNGWTNGFTFMQYDPVLLAGNTVPQYSQWKSSITTSTQTTFDGAGTRFFNYRDSYSEPGSGDKYLKFPQNGVFT